MGKATYEAYDIAIEGMGIVKNPTKPPRIMSFQVLVTWYIQARISKDPIKKPPNVLRPETALQALVVRRRQEKRGLDRIPIIIAEAIVIEVTFPESQQPKPASIWSSTIMRAVSVPQLKAIASINLRQSVFLNSFLSWMMQLYLGAQSIALAALLGGDLGFSLKKMVRRRKGTVMMMASSMRKDFISSVVAFLPIIKLGIEAPTVLDIMPARTPVNVTIPTLSFLNQLRATLLGVFRTKILPMAASADPKRQKTDCSTSNNSLSQAPALTRIAAATKQGRIPNLLMRKLKGKARIGCVMVKRRPLRVTSISDILNLSSTTTLMLEKVWTGMELTRQARIQTVRMTNLYLSSLNYLLSVAITRRLFILQIRYDYFSTFFYFLKFRVGSQPQIFISILKY